MDFSEVDSLSVIMMCSLSSRRQRYGPSSPVFQLKAAVYKRPSLMPMAFHSHVGQKALSSQCLHRKPEIAATTVTHCHRLTTKLCISERESLLLYVIPPWSHAKSLLIKLDTLIRRWGKDMVPRRVWLLAGSGLNSSDPCPLPNARLGDESSSGAVLYTQGLTVRQFESSLALPSMLRMHPHGHINGSVAHCTACSGAGNVHDVRHDITMIERSSSSCHCGDRLALNAVD